MTRNPTRGVSLFLGIALAFGLALTAAIGMPATGLAAERSKAVSPGKVTQLKRVATLNGQFVSLSKRVKGCPAAAADLRAANKLRTTANRGARRASVARLKTKKRIMSTAVVRLSRAAKRCALSPQAGGTSTVLVPVAGGPGGSGAPGSFSTQLRLGDLVGGTTLDLGQLLGGSLLPSDLIAVDVTDLGGSRCISGSTVCVGVDTAALGRAVDSLVSANLSLGPLLGLDLTVLGNEVDRLLAAGDLGSLLTVTRVGDQLLRVVPAGPLAQLAGLADVPNDVIGTIQLVR